MTTTFRTTRPTPPRRGRLRRAVWAVGAGISTTVRGTVGLALLVGVLAGIPWAMTRFVGPPWPRSWPSLDVVGALDGVGRQLEAGQTRPLVVSVLAVVVWAGWARLALAFLVQLGALARRVPVPRVRGLGSAQQLVAVVLAGASAIGSSSAVLGPAMAASAVAAEADDPAQDSPAQDSPAQGEDAPAPGNERTVTVRRGDSFWSIAARSTGDGRRWRELVTLNTGRQVAPGVWFERTTTVIHPGWVLAVPVGSRAQPDRVGVGGGTVVVAAGDTLSSLAARHLGDPGLWPKLWDANQGRRFGTRTFSDPNLILPGWELRLPGGTPAPPASGPGGPGSESPTPEPSATDLSSAGGSTPRPEGASLPPVVLGVPFLGGPVLPPAAEEGPSPTPTVPPATVLAPATVLPEMVPTVQPASEPLPTAGSDLVPWPGDGEADGGSGSGPGMGPVLAAGAAAAAGAVAVRWRRSSTDGPRLGARPGARGPGEAALIRLDRAHHEFSVGERQARLERVWRAAVGHLAGQAPIAVGTVPVDLAVALVGDDGDIVVVATSSLGAPPAGWSQPAPDRWRLGPEVATRDVEPSLAALARSAPLLVPIGTAADGATVHAELMALGRLGVDGPEPVRRMVIRAITVGLVALAEAVTADVWVAGLEADDLPPGFGSEATPVWASQGTGAGWVRRPAPAEDPWGPVVAVVAGADVMDLASHANAADHRSGGRAPTVVLGCTSDAGGWRLVCTETGWQLDPLGLAVAPCGLEHDDARVVGALLDRGRRPAEVNGGDRTTVSLRQPEVRSPSEAGPVALRVGVLGPVQLSAVDDLLGAPVAFERAKSLELVVWLALNRGSGTRSGARSALWDASVRDTTVSNVISDARRTLARAAPGSPASWIERGPGDRLLLTHTVTTDVDLLRTAVHRARLLDRPDAAAVAEVEAALALVRGVPFCSVDWAWPETDGLIAEASLLVLEAAALVSIRALDAGEVERASQAAGVGLIVLPTHEPLVAVRLQAAACRDESGAVRFEWEAYQRALAADRWSAGPSPDLLRLARELGLGPVLVAS